MVGITLSPEQIRAAPPDVRRWLEHEISTALGFGLNAAAPAAPRQHLISCGLEEARVLLSSIAGMLPVVAVFFELGREPAMPASPRPRGRMSARERTRPPCPVSRPRPVEDADAWSPLVDDPVPLQKPANNGVEK